VLAGGEAARRLVEAGDDERRRLERRLADGPGRILVEIAEELATLGATGEPFSRRLAEATEEIARLARGLRPRALDEDLATALREVVRGVPVAVALDVDVRDAGTGATTAAYYVCLEAITNAVRHAGATAVEVGGRVHDGRLTVEVRDDGNGGAALDRGSGLRGLEARCAALGGSLRVEGRPGSGSVVYAEIPCG
jgi:signal transduction histidine kinase